MILRGVPGECFDEMNTLPGRVAEVLHQPNTVSVADQQAQHGGIAVHRFDGDGGEAVLAGPRFLGFQQALRQARLALRGQHAAEPAV